MSGGGGTTPDPPAGPGALDASAAGKVAAALG